MIEDTTDLATLHDRVIGALVDLTVMAAGMVADDDAADPARHAIRLTRHTLECFWLPTLETLTGDASYDDV